LINPGTAELPWLAGEPPEDDREDSHGEEAIDRSGLDADHAGEPPALEDGLDDAERWGDREHVHERRLWWISGERNTPSSRSAESRPSRDGW
jgi:hypothetical protein